jgi:hypothetical protein
MDVPPLPPKRRVKSSEVAEPHPTAKKAKPAPPAPAADEPQPKAKKAKPAPPTPPVQAADEPLPKAKKAKLASTDTVGAAEHPPKPKAKGKAASGCSAPPPKATVPASPPAAAEPKAAAKARPPSKAKSASKVTPDSVPGAVVETPKPCLQLSLLDPEPDSESCPSTCTQILDMLDEIAAEESVDVLNETGPSVDKVHR